QRERLVEQALATAGGGIDVLVHNAGVEHIGAFETRDGAALADTLAINLLAPLDLVRRLLPDMLARGRGHIVMVASLAGAGGPAYAADYAATKAGQIAFTRSLRSEYRARGVSASVVLPGYVSDAGMFARRRQAGAVDAPRVLGTVRRADVAAAVVRAIAEDRREVYVARRGTRLAVAIGELVPTLGDRMSRWSGADEVMRDWGGRPGPGSESGP
ncbi:MAG: SDR family NAD(P)-dependent oxidoreductase, partial [Longimicrobiales bacterium]